MNREIVLLDGGMGQELIRRAPSDPTPLWSARVMLDHPEIVQHVHEEYLRAGARMLTLNTYSASRVKLEAYGAPEHFETLQTRAGNLAVAALDATGADAALAGCVAPLVWSYRPDVSPPADQAAPYFAEAARLQAPFIDVMLCETMASIDEARGAAMGAGEAGKPIWIAFTVDDGDGTRLRSGESLADGIAEIRDMPGMQAILVNCSIPEAVDTAIPVLAESGLPFGAYANGFTGIAAEFAPGTTVGHLSARRDLGPEAYADFALRWAQAGASILGGCCEVGPAHIATLGQRLEAAGYTLKKELSI